MFAKPYSGRFRSRPRDPLPGLRATVLGGGGEVADAPREAHRVQDRRREGSGVQSPTPENREKPWVTVAT